MTGRHWLTYLACWAAGLASGLVASIVPTYLPDIALRTVGEASGPGAAGFGATIQSLFLLGWVGGGIALGPVADRKGRAPVLGATMLGAVVASALAVLAPGPTTFGLARLVAGGCVGAVMAVSTTLGAEILPDARRPLFMGILANAYAAGIIGAGALQAAPLSFGAASAVVLLLGAPALLFFTSLGAGASQAKAPATAPAQGSAPRVTLRAALGASRRDVAVGVVLFGSMLIAVWAAFSWLPTWASERFPGDDGGAAIRGRVMIALGGAAVAGSLLVAPLARWLGRVRGILATYLGVAVLSAWLYGLPPATPAGFVGAIAALGVVFGMSQALLSCYVPELFPAAVRATAVGLCFNVGRTVTAVAVLQIGLVAEWLGGFRQALLASSLVLLIGIAAVPFAREGAALRDA